MDKESNPKMAAKLALLYDNGRKRIPARIKAIQAQWADLKDKGWPRDKVEQLYRLVHGLVGAAGTFGMPNVGRAAEKLEQQVNQILDQGGLPTAQEREELDSRLEALIQTMANPDQPLSKNSFTRHSQEDNQPLIHIVEDDEALAKSLAAELEQTGYAVEVFTELQAFKSAYLGPDKPAAVIMDMIFPEGNEAGAQAIRELRKECACSVPVIYMSVRTDMQARLAALHTGATRYLTKPFDTRKLLRMLDEITLRTPIEPYRILLIDDDSTLLEYHATLLEQSGMATHGITDPLQTLDAARACDPEVIIVDMYMPGCSGLELAAILRGDDAFTETPLLFLSTEERLERQLPALALGGDDFLTKPVETESFIRTVKIRARRARRLRELNEDLHTALQEIQIRQYAIDQHAIVSIIDPCGKITYVNDNLCTLSGYSRAELLGQNHRILKSGHHRELLFKQIESTLKSGEIWRGRMHNQRKDGSGYWVEYTIVPFLDAEGKPYQHIAVGTDITPIKAVETALHESEQRLHLSQEFAGIGTWEWDIRTGTIYWSGNAATLFGLPANTRQSRYQDALAIIHPDDREQVRDTLESCVEKGAEFSAEYQVVWPDGSIHWLNATGDISQIDNHKPVRMLGAVQDITERKQAAAELITAKEIAEKANRAKSIFLSHMTHELRTPLNAILGYAQLLELQETTAPKRQRALMEINKAGEHLLRLVNDLLDLAKIESEHIELSMEAVSCHDLVWGCLDLVTPEASKRNIQLKFDEKEYENAALRGDPVRLRQALLNLLSNAVKYNREGGQVTVQMQGTGRSRLRILVTDTGPGIPPESQSELFQPFNRLDAARSKIEGTGLGLTISRRLVELMDGQLDFESKPGEGSTFRIELPLAS